MCQQQSGEHLDDAEQLSVLYHKEVVLTKLCVSLVRWSVTSVIRNYLSESFNETNALEQEHRDLPIHLAHVQSHGIVDHGKLVFDLLHDRRADQNLNQEFLALNAFKRCSVLQMQSNQAEELRQKGDAKEDLGWSVQAP